MKKRVKDSVNIVILKFIFYFSFITRLLMYFNILKSKDIRITDKLKFSSNLNNIFFKNEIKKSKLYLEFGSGRTTLFAQKLKKNL